jgi:dTDP-4-amino-4,6-dideoxygalactose transaminase
MRVPFLDLTAQYESIKEDIDRAIAAVIAENAFVRGRFVHEFEASYAEQYGIKHCIGVANGTDALFIVLKMLGIGPGDEVITAANSWISSSEVITLTGATPVFVDIEEDYYNLDTARLEAKITDRTRAIIPVHLYGQPAAIDTVMAIADNHGLAVLEDCAQAHFSTLAGERVGTFGNAATFSFYPGKNLGAYGDAGCIVTNDDALAAAVRSFANHGSNPEDKHQHIQEGINSRLDGIQAAILSAKLPHIQEWNQRRAHWGARYTELLADVEEVVTPAIRPGATHVFHIYCVRVPQREALQAFLADRGISTGIHYPTALPFLDAYEYLAPTEADFPVAARFQDEILSLPMFPELTDEQVVHVASSIREFYAPGS